MLPNLETYAAAAKVNRQITLRCAERRALLFATATRPPVSPGSATVGNPALDREGVAGVVRALHALVRPVPA